MRVRRCPKYNSKHEYQALNIAFYGGRELVSADATYYSYDNFIYEYIQYTRNSIFIIHLSVSDN